MLLLGLFFCRKPTKGFSVMVQRHNNNNYNNPPPTTNNNQQTQQQIVFSSRSLLLMQRLQLATNDWSSFQALEDDDEVVFGKQIDRKKYADENDDPSMKAAIGSMIEAPTTLHDVDPIYVPAGSKLDLDEDTVLGLLSACRSELGTLFGYTEENRGVGITGSFEFVEIDAGTVVLSLAGRYWHQRTAVLDRIANYLQQRIPEILEVTVVDPYQLTDEANTEAL